jgi:dephospho-CoA kinase
MPLFYITGPTASGKTTVGEALKAKGYEVHDTDTEGMRYRTDNGAVELADKPIHDLHEKAKDKTIFLVGTTANDTDFRDLFDKIFLLTVDEQAQAHRINTRTNHTYGKLPHQFAAAQKWRPVQIEKYHAAGAIEIDATQPIEQVVNEILNKV